MSWEITPVYQAWGAGSALLFLVVLLLVGRRAGLGLRDVLLLGVVSLVCLYLGARLFWELVEFPHMGGRMWVRVAPLHERLPRPLGFTYLGGLAALVPAGLAVGALPFVRPGPGRVLDVLAPPAAFGFAWSKVGCLLAGCCYGAATRVWYAVRMTTVDSDEPVSMVPVRLLEMGFSVLLGAGALALLLDTRLARRLGDGAVFAWYLTLASFARFGAGYLRGPYEIVIGPLQAVQWGALVMGCAGLAAATALTLRRPSGRKDGGP
jgi:phosphatidylglycerol:prolipoprotein diacylglycerol transferase